MKPSFNLACAHNIVVRILEIVITLQRTLIIVFSLTTSGEEGLRSSLNVVISS